jgi:uncharacterized protein (DUF1684 family)
MHVRVTDRKPSFRSHWRSVNASWLVWTMTAWLALSLAKQSASADPASAPPDWIAWKAQRLESLAGPEGWTTLAGLSWLREGTNLVGTNLTDQIRLPAGRAAGEVGAFIRIGHTVRFEAAPEVSALMNDRSVRSAELRSDLDPLPTKLRIGSLGFELLERGERLGVRFRDPEAPTRTHFHGVPYFRYDPAWRIEGEFEPFAVPRSMRVADVTGGTQEFPSRGAIRFSYHGTEYRLDIAEEPGDDDFFIMFRDSTSGESTYEAGRFLHVAKPDARGHVVVDFNRAYTPPCGFTPFAICPIAPRQNSLPIAVRAGELKPTGLH